MAEFNNGICYAFTNGKVSNGELMLTDEFLNEITIKLAKLHSIKIETPEIKYITHFERFRAEIDPMMNEIQQFVDDEIEKVDVLIFKNFAKLSQLEEEKKMILNKLNELGGLGEICLCHNDVNSNNLIWNNEKEHLNKIGIIDFEMVMNNYVTFELAYLFMSFSGYFQYNFNKNQFPNQTYRQRFIVSYLQERLKLDNKVISELEFEKKTNWLFNSSNLAGLYCFLDNSISMPRFPKRPI